VDPYYAVAISVSSKPTRYRAAVLTWRKPVRRKRFNSCCDVLLRFVDPGAEATQAPSPSPKPAMTKAQSQKIIVATENKLGRLGRRRGVDDIQAVQDGTCGGTAMSPMLWASSAYVKRGSKWFAASHQETPAK
jgi:hypothetical protein